MAIETELKLVLEPEAAAFLEASSLLAGPARTVSQKAIYFDTAGHALRSNGLSLRIRRTGRKRVQTVKALNGSAAGLFARAEWEMPVASDEPVIDEGGPLSALLEKLEKKDLTVSPIFEVQVERRIWNLGAGQSEIELALDRGAAKAAGRQSGICEIELELRSGDPSALFSLARAFDAIAPVRLGILTKAERGYGLLGRASFARKAEPLTLEAGITTAEAFRRIASSCLGQYRLNEALLFEAWHTDALHQARVALRRLRSAFTVFKPLLVGDGRAGDFKLALRNLSNVLGEARNLDVLSEKGSDMAIQQRIDLARERAYTIVKEELASARIRALMLDLAEWLAHGDWTRAQSLSGIRDGRCRDFARSALARLRKRIGKHGRKLKSGTDEERHDVRKDAKKLRYASEFFDSLFDAPKRKRRHAKFIDALEKLQDQLGALNDRATARELIASLGLDEKETVALLGTARRGKLLDRADAAWKELVDLKPFWH